MNITTEEVRKIIREIWSVLYFQSYGAYRDGIDKYNQMIEEALDKFDESEIKKMAEQMGGDK